MDLAQKANRVKRDLQAAAHKPEQTSIRHAIESFDSFVDGIVEEIRALKAAQKSHHPADAEESLVPASSEPEVAPPADPVGRQEAENPST